MAKSKQLCRGCNDDCYNGEIASVCWCFEDAKIVIRSAVGTWDPPPYTWRPQKVLDCYKPKGEHWLKFDDCRMEHNWKKKADAK